MNVLSRHIIASVATLLSLAFGAAQAQSGVPAFDGLVVFGESISGTGNGWILTGRKVWDPTQWDGALGTLPTEAVPPLYDNGRWSNGAVWVEVLADMLGVARPAPSLDGGLNYAFTNARSGYGKNVRYSVWTGEELPKPRVPSVGKQTRHYALNEGDIPAHHLAILSIGGNDVSLARRPHDVANAVRNIKRHVRALIIRGARHLLVPNQVDASSAPVFAQLSALQRAAIRATTIEFNAQLALMLDDLQSRHGPDVTIYPMDFFSLGESVFADPECFGFVDTSTPAALEYLQANGAVEIADPIFDRFVFWDTIHPTKAIHFLLAQAAASFVFTGEVPACGSE